MEMMKHKPAREDRLGTLILRAAVTVVLVLGLIFGLRSAGLLAQEEDVPVHIVEELISGEIAEQE